MTKSEKRSVKQASEEVEEVEISEVCQYLINHDTILSTQLDVSCYVEEALTAILSKSTASSGSTNQKRIDGYLFMTTYLKSISGTSATVQTQMTKRLIGIVDRLSVLIESMNTSDPQEADAFIQFLVVLTMDWPHSTEFTAIWTKLHTKIFTSCQRLLTKNGIHSLCGETIFRIFSVFFQSRLRTIISQHTKMVKDLVVKTLFQSNSVSYQDVLIELYGAICTQESLEFFMLSWQILCIEAVRTLNTLSLSSIRNVYADTRLQVEDVFKKLHPNVGVSGYEKAVTAVGKTGDVTLMIDWNAIHALKLRGVAKTVFLEKQFECIMKLLNTLLVRGSSAGFVTMDLSTYFALYSAILPSTVDSNTSDPANFIENDNGVSNVDVSFVLSRVKIMTLLPMTTILQLNLLGLLPHGTQIISPLLSLLHKTEVRRVPTLFTATIRCLQAALPSLTTSIVLNINQGSVGLLELFRKQVTLLTTNRSTVNTSSLASKSEKAASVAAGVTESLFTTDGRLRHYEEIDVESDNDVVAIEMLNTIELLILHGGALLSPALRSSIESSIQELLVCMERGLLVSQQHDRRLRRLVGERIRFSPALQKAALSLAATEVLTSTATGTAVSGNLVFLRNVATAATRMPFVGQSCETTLASHATRILISLGHIVHPTAVVLPSLAYDTLAKKFSAQEDAMRNADLTAVSAPTQRSSTDQVIGDVSSINVPMSLAEATGAALAAKRSAPTETPSIDEPVVKKPSLLNNPSAATVASATVVSKPVAAASSVAPSKTIAKNAQDSDDDLPDIDVDMGSDEDDL